MISMTTTEQQKRLGNLARILPKGKIVKCYDYCGHEFEITESLLHQPSYAVEVSCPGCGGMSPIRIWETYTLYDRSTEDLFQEAIDVLGFLPLYDHENWPISFSSEIHKDGGPENCYSLVKDMI